MEVFMFRQLFNLCRSQQVTSNCHSESSFTIILISSYQQRVRFRKNYISLPFFPILFFLPVNPKRWKISSKFDSFNESGYLDDKYPKEIHENYPLSPSSSAKDSRGPRKRASCNRLQQEGRSERGPSRDLKIINWTILNDIFSKLNWKLALQDKNIDNR